MINIPIEIERKYIIEIPSEEKMRECADYFSSEITQTYLKSQSHVTHRVRKRVRDGKAEYTETKKVRIDRMSAYEDEKVISEEEYLNLLSEMREDTRSIVKRRHSFYYEGQNIEVDVYPEWRRTCVMETELSSRDAFAPCPPFIKIIKEVTGDKEYSNASMAIRFPKEIEVR